MLVSFMAGRLMPMRDTPKGPDAPKRLSNPKRCGSLSANHVDVRCELEAGHEGPHENKVFGMGTTYWRQGR
jgi:hypothetical protein